MLISLDTNVESGASASFIALVSSMIAKFCLPVVRFAMIVVVGGCKNVSNRYDV